MKKILEKWHNLPSSVKTSLAFIFSSFVIKGIAFITTPLFTRIIKISEYGIITTYNSWVSIIEIFALLGLTSAGVFNVGLNDNKKTRNEYISSCLGLCNLSTIIVFLFIFILKIIFKDKFLVDEKLLIIMFVHFLFSPAQIFWITRQRYEYKYKLATFITIFSILFSQLCAVLFVLYLGGKDSFNKILGNEIGALLFTIPIFIYLINKGKEYINLRRWKVILLLSLPLIPHYLAQHVMASSDKIMISNMIGTREAAIYGVVVSMGMIGTIFWNAVNATIVPYTFDKIENNKTEELAKLAKKLLNGYFIVLIFIILIAPEILMILAPREYYSGIYCVPPLNFTIFMQALYNIFANIEFYYKKTSWIAKATVFSTVINLILNYIFIPKFGFVAAAYTTLVSYVILVLMHYINYKKCQGNIYDIKHIVYLSIFFFIIASLSNVLYLLARFVRYLIILIIFIYSIYNKEKIKNTFTEIKK